MEDLKPFQHMREGNFCVINRPFRVVCLVAWPLNENEAGGDLVLIETSMLF